MDPLNKRLLRLGKKIVDLAEDEHLPAEAFVYLLATLHQSAVAAMDITKCSPDATDDEPVGSC